MAILSLDTIFNAGRVQQGLAAMNNRIASMGRNLRGVESTADRARRALRQMNAEQLNAAKVQAFGQGGFSSVENAEGFGITGFGRGKGPGLFTSQGEAQSILDQQRISMERLTRATDRQIESSKKSTTQNRRQGVSFTQLLGLMIKFGIALTLISIPGRIAGIFGEIIKGGTESQAALAGVNALLRVSRDEIMDLGRVTRLLGADLGVSGDAFAALEEAASSIGGFPASQVRTMVGGIRLANSELQTTVDLFELAARASVAGGLQIEDAMRAATTITSGFGVSVDDANIFMDIMFKTVDKGNIRMSELARNFGDLTGSMQLLFGSDPVRQVKEFEAVMVGLATATRTLTPAEAITAQRNLLKGFVDASSESLKLRNRLKELGVNLQINDIVAQGYEATLREINDTIGTQGRLMNELVAANQDQVNVMGEANFRQATFVKLITGLFPNIRQVRSLQAQLNNEMKLYNEISKDFVNATGETDKQLAIRQETMANAIGTFKQFIALIKEELFFNIGVPLGNALRQVNDFIKDIVNTDRFKDADFIGKLGILWESFITAFNVWWFGGGEKSILDKSTMVAKRFSAGLVKFLTNDEQLGTFIRVGQTLAFGIIKGMAIGLTRPILDIPGLSPESTQKFFQEQGRLPSTIGGINKIPGISHQSDEFRSNLLIQGQEEEIQRLQSLITNNRSGTNITVNGVTVGSVDEIGQAIVDLSKALDDGPVVPRDDRVSSP